jgi:NTP pyrophosphatase (non-canonical NTP hydrolase)
MEGHMKKIDLEMIHQEIEQMVQDRDWDQFHTIKNLTMALNVESAELMEIFQWMSESQSHQAKDNPLLKSQVADEVADVFVYLLRIVSKMEINLEDAILKKLKKNCEKYPVEKSKGNAIKYNKL